ncbi:MAG: urease accessory protein UreD [Luteolibacter sp.]
MTGNSLSGHLRLRCDASADGVPYLSEQSFQVPAHLSKGHLSDDEKILVLTIVNPTAGFFDGDKIESEVTVGKGAALALSTPSSSRVFRTRSGMDAVCGQIFSVESGGFLEWIPEVFIPHQGARYVQKTEVELEPDAGLLFIDWISPGRVARGEIFQYENLRWEFDLRLGGKLIARERYDMSGEGLEGITAMFEAGHYVSIYVAGEMLENFPAAEVDALGNEDTYLGHGLLEGGEVMVIRALCRDSLAARRLIERIRVVLYEAAKMKVPSLGRLSM